MSNSLSDNSGLITATIKPKIQTYYLVTEETLGSIKEKSTVSDILMLITSLLFGAFFSVLIALNASTILPKQTISTLSIYQWVFFGFGSLFLIMTLVTLSKGNKIIENIKSTETTISSITKHP